MNNICHFINVNKKISTLYPIHFVKETMAPTEPKLHTEALYKMCYVQSGRGVCYLNQDAFPIADGDLFFTFPSTMFSVTSKKDLVYYYISFLGERGMIMLEQAKINKKNFLFHGFTETMPLWTNGIKTTASLQQSICEGILLFVFSLLADSRSAEREPLPIFNAGQRIRLYLDEHYMDASLSLDIISRDLGYHKKYVSASFKRETGCTVTEYLTQLRVQQATVMINCGYDSITQISERCGFADANYFSRVFHRQLQISPRDYIRSVRMAYDNTDHVVNG